LTETKGEAEGGLVVGLDHDLDATQKGGRLSTCKFGGGGDCKIRRKEGDKKTNKTILFNRT